MGKKRICLFFMLALIIQETYSAECKPEDNMTMERKLTAKLLCNYNKDVRPVKKSADSMDINTEIMILTVKTSYERASVDAITLYTMTILKWKDEFLTWNPKEYDGIHDVMIDSPLIWTPEISVIDVNKRQRQYMTKPCSVFWTGKVYCYEKFSYSMSCSKTYKEWPYDTHNCSAVFGIWMQEKHSDIRFTDPEISIEGSQQNKFWNLLSATIDTADETIKNLRHPRVKINMTIKRNSVVLEYEYLMPIFAMIIISLSSLCLEIKSAERMILMVYNIFLHFRYLEHIGVFAPIVDADMPDAIIYIRDSLFLSCGILVAGMMLLNISKQTSATPSWIKSVNGIMDSQIGRIVMYGDFEPQTVVIPPAVEEEDDIAKTEAKMTTDNGWQSFSLVLNRLTFICVCLIYVFLILRFLI